MPFIDFETADETSVIELYTIAYGAQLWFGTSSPLSFSDPSTSRTYTPMGFRRERIVYGADTGKSSLKIQAPIDAPFLDIFKVQQPSSVVSLTITRLHLDDPALQQRILWSGRIIAPVWETAHVTLNCERIQASAQRYGLRRIMMPGCPHTIYNQARGNCRVRQEDHELETTVIAISNRTITVADTGAQLDYYAGGVMQWSHSSLAATERAEVVSNQAGTGVFIVATRPSGLILGATVRIYPTCDKTLTMCAERFNNIANYGGFPYTPNKELFGGDLIY